MSSTIILYTDSRFYSPYAMSAYVALYEKKLPFELETVDLAAAENQQEAYAELSLTRRVPTLLLDEFTLSESSAIAEYLEARFAPPDYPALYPRDREQCAVAREIQAWLRSDLLPLREERPTEVIFAAEKKGALSVAGEHSAAKLIAGAQRLLADGRQNLFGAWCIADSDLALMLNRLAMNDDELPAPLAAYVRHQWQRPALRAWQALSA